MSPSRDGTRSPSALATMRPSPNRRCTGRLSSSTRRAVSKSPRRNDMDAIIVCAFARVLGEPEPSASSSSRRSRPSCSWFRSCQKRQSAEPILRPTSASPASSAQIERGADVVPLCVETLEPFALLRAEQARLGLLRQHEVEAGVTTPDGLAVAARHQTLERVLADGLEHSQARLVPACVLGREQVVAEQRLDRPPGCRGRAARRRARRRPA